LIAAYEDSVMTVNNYVLYQLRYPVSRKLPIDHEYHIRTTMSLARKSALQELSAALPGP